SMRNVFGAVAGSVVRSEQVVGEAHDQRRRGNSLELVARQRRDNGGVVQQPQPPGPHRQNVSQHAFSSSSLLAARVLDDGWGRGENRSSQRTACDSRRQPEEEVRLESGIEQESGFGSGLLWHRAFGPLLDLKRIGSRNQKDQCGGAFRMSQSKLHRG